MQAPEKRYPSVEKVHFCKISHGLCAPPCPPEISPAEWHLRFSQMFKVDVLGVMFYLKKADTFLSNITQSFSVVYLFKSQPVYPKDFDSALFIRICGKALTDLPLMISRGIQNDKSLRSLFYRKENLF